MSERPVLGIDLGTTYSCVAHLDDTGRAVVVPDSESESASPSVASAAIARAGLVAQSLVRIGDLRQRRPG